MKPSIHLLAKATAAKIGIDAYQKAHHPLSPEELQALRDLSIRAQEWEDYAKTLEGEHCATVLESLQKYEDASEFKKANIILLGRDNKTVCEFNGYVPLLIQSLSLYITGMTVCFCAEDNDRGIVSIYAQLDEEE